jgi:excinuclease ABC subunit C
MAMPAAIREERLEAQLAALPAQPGVYLFRGAGDDVLYVGKAKSLRARVRSYFRGGDTRQGLDQLVARVEGIEVIVTQSEGEALHLEQNLIKRHRPAFNVRLRDDKSYPYIAVTVEDEYPRVMFTRERHRRGVVYFGPYSSAKKVRETLDVLNRAFRFRPCEGPKPGRHSGIPCLDYHIDRCLAPCIGAVSPEDYRAVIDGVVEFLSGETRPILRELERKMKDAAERQEFEEAARNRNRLYAVRHLAERQAADRRDIGTVDVIGLAARGEVAAVQVFPLRDGRMVDRHGFALENVAGQDAQALVEAFCLEYYGSAPSVPPLVVVPPGAGDLSALEEVLSARRGSRVEVRAALRGEKRRLQELAQRNAELALDHEELAASRRRLRRIEGLEELREALNLESLPVRIECFDISNIQEESPVGSMVVFEDAAAKKAHYRKFGVQRQGGQDDFAMMAEVVSRRFARMAAAQRASGSWGAAGKGGEAATRRAVRASTVERRDRSILPPAGPGGGEAGLRPAGVGAGQEPEEYDESFAAVPNLVVVDGGKGQLAAALRAIHELDLPRVAVISLAKRDEEVFVPGVPGPIRLERDSAGLQLLQRIRDEAHRFALGFHRTRRDARAKESILDALPGVGPARRRALLQHFGSTERLLGASREELEGVPGLPPRVGRQIHAALHKAGGA